MAANGTARLTQQGTTFFRSTDGASYSAQASFSDIEGPDLQRSGSPDTVLADTLETNTPAWQSDATRVKLQIYYTGTVLAQFITDFNAKTNPLYFKIQYVAASGESTGATITAQYWVARVGTGKSTANSKDKVMCAVELERMTVPVLTAGS